MDQPGPTRHSLIARIRDADDDQAWSEFVEVYSPVQPTRSHDSDW